MDWQVVFRLRSWYNYIQELGHFSAKKTPTSDPQTIQKRKSIMDSQTLPVFSDYQSMRRTNPNAYWSTKVQTEMVDAYKFHGPSFFDRTKR